MTTRPSSWRSRRFRRRPPGERFVYSDINFFLLGEIVSGSAANAGSVHARPRVHAARHEGHDVQSAGGADPRIAPTESCTPFGWPCEGPDMKMLRGVVHDPTARRMDGVAGHAGLFSTAADLAIFCRMLLNGGSYRRRPRSLAADRGEDDDAGHAGDDRNVRALGWDIDSSFSSNRGELLPIGSFGHTGFTGTSLWIDPATKMFVVFLSNRVHPDGKGDVTPLRARGDGRGVRADRRRVAGDRATFSGRDFGAGPAPLPRTGRHPC